MQTLASSKYRLIGLLDYVLVVENKLDKTRYAMNTLQIQPSADNKKSGRKDGNN